jgi:predicted DNA-binding protein
MKFGPSETSPEAATLTLPPVLSARLAEAAASEGRSPSDLATEAIERYLGGAG